VQIAQEADEDIAEILKLIKQSAEKPSWEAVAMLGHDAQVLWSYWTR